MDALEALHQVCGATALSPAVFEQVVVVGEQLGKNEVWAVKAAIDKGWVAPIALSPEEEQIVHSLRQEYRALGLGECQALAYGEKRNWLLLVEERKARVVARARGVRYSIIQVLCFKAIWRGNTRKVTVSLSWTKSRAK